MSDLIQKAKQVAENILNLNYEDAVVEAQLVLEGVAVGGTYDIHSFATEFQQGIDHKGQPSTEEKGGLLSITIDKDKNESDFFNNWILSRSMKMYSGWIIFRNPKAGVSPRLSIYFKDAVCISYQKVIEDDGEDIFLKLLLSPRSVIFGTVEHNNGTWKNT